MRRGEDNGRVSHSRERRGMQAAEGPASASITRKENANSCALGNTEIGDLLTRTFIAIWSQATKKIENPALACITGPAVET